MGNTDFPDSRNLISDFLIKIGRLHYMTLGLINFCHQLFSAYKNIEEDLITGFDNPRREGCDDGEYPVDFKPKWRRKIRNTF